MGLASSAFAGQVELSVENRLGGDSNVFRSSGERTQDGTHEITPRLAVRDDDENVGYEFGYQPTYRTFFETSGIDGLDHVASGRVNWDVSPQDRIIATGSYSNGRQFVFGDDAFGNVTTFDVNDRERIRQSDANLGYQHRFTPALSGRLDAFVDDFDASGTDDQSQNDSQAFTGRVSANYALTERASVGLLVTGRRRDNRAVGLFRASSLTDVWDVMGSIRYQLTPTLELSLQMGPSFIRQQQIPRGAFLRSPSCNEVSGLLGCVRIPKDESRDVSLFAVASASKQWKTSDVSLSYIRSEARSGTASSSSSIADRLELNYAHRWSDDWTFRLIGGWDHYEQLFRLADDEDAGKLTLDSYRATGTVEYVLSRHLMLIGQYSFYHQRTEVGDGADPDPVDVHTGYAGVRFTFEPLSY